VRSSTRPLTGRTVARDDEAYQASKTERLRCAGWQRPIDRREDFVASLDHLVGYQCAGLAERIIVFRLGERCKTSQSEGDGHRPKPPARLAPRTPKRTADSTKNYKKVWKCGKSVPGTSRPFISVERLDPSDRFVLGHSWPIRDHPLADGAADVRRQSLRDKPLAAVVPILRLRYPIISCDMFPRSACKQPSSPECAR
jgi:hypothetical protein